MDIDQLFIDQSDSKVSTTSMPDSFIDWGDFLINELLKQNPILSGRRVEVSFTAENEEAKTALGSLVVKNEDNKKIMHVPFVINMGQLEPLDVFFKNSNSDPMPLTPSRVRECFFQAKLSSGLSPYPRDGSISDDGFDDYSPYQNASHIPGSGLKLAAQLNNIHGSRKHAMDRNVMDEVRDALEISPPNILDDIVASSSLDRMNKIASDLNTPEGKMCIYKMSENGTQGAIQKIAMHENHAMPYESNMHTCIVPPMVNARIVKQAANNYDVYIGYANGDKGLIKSAGSGKVAFIAAQIEQDPKLVMNEVERSGERVISAKHRTERNGTSLIDELVPSNWTTVKSGQFGKVNVHDSKSGAYHAGYIFGNTYKKDGALSNKKLFIKPGFVHAYQDNIAIDFIDGGLKDKRIGALQEISPAIGKRATFVWHDSDKSEECAMMPFKIMGITRTGIYSGASVILKVEFDDGSTGYLCRATSHHVVKPISFSISSKDKSDLGSEYGHVGRLSFQRLSMSERKKSFLYPSNSIMVSIGPKTELASSNKQSKSLEKLARYDQGHKVHVSFSPARNTFHVKTPGKELQKTARDSWGYNNASLSPNEAVHFISAHGTSLDLAEKVIKTAAEQGNTNVYIPSAEWKEDLSLKLAREKHVELEKMAFSVIDKIDSMNLLKLASEVSDKNSVANILSLKMFGPATMSKFVSHIKPLEKTLSHLCGLLLAARITDEVDIDQSEGMTVVKGLDNVLDSLKEMRAVMKVK